MLDNTELDALAARTLTYLHDTVGIHAAVSEWPDAEQLPYHLLEQFTCRTLQLGTTPVLLALDAQASRPRLADVGKAIRALRQRSNWPVLYVTGALAAYERKRLIAQRIPFLVPGTQLYLPELGIDLREYFPRALPAPNTPLSPSTQALLFRVLLGLDSTGEWRATDIGAHLGYTPMTVSRAIRELTGAGLVLDRRQGRTRWFHLADNPAECWERARPLLRTPVARRLWIASMPAEHRDMMAVAGLSALAERTALAAPEHPVWAISQQTWLRVQHQVAVLMEPEPGSMACEVWRYDPTRIHDAHAVDPLSLIVSLADVPEERVQMALENLRRQLPW